MGYLEEGTETVSFPCTTDQYFGFEEERMSGPGKQESPLEPCGLQEVNAEQGTGGRGWMCTRQRAAHTARTEESRGINVRWERAGGKTRGQE